MDTKKIFIVEGNIGAGKSTFLRLIKEKLSVQVVFEPLSRWQNVGNGGNLLEKFYQDTSRWGYTFQTYAFITRIMEQQEQALENPFRAQVLERSVYSDRYCFAKNCFEMGTISKLEWDLYQQWFEWLVDNYSQKPDGFIYLRTSPEVCYERLKKRAREEESIIAFNYLKLLNDKHEDWLINKKEIAEYLVQTPVLSLDCDNDFESSSEELEKHIQKIQEFIEITSLNSSLKVNKITCEIQV